MTRPIATYHPPVLPEYLKKVCDLEPIVGTPSDEQVKAIHAVIRAAHTASQIPGMFDPGLSMSLAQHLFEVQMAKYREEYPCGMFPEDMVHTPPTLPPKAPVKLEPIHGIPSDKELQGVQAAVRAYEQLSGIPSMFDPNVSMELSQHLFNIQFARYMHRATRATVKSADQPHPTMEATPEPTTSTSTVQPTIDPTPSSHEQPPSTSNNRGSGEGPVVAHRPPVSTAIPETQVSQIAIGRFDRLLEQMVEKMDNINRVLVGTQNSHAMSWRYEYMVSGQHGKASSSELVNIHGDLPSTQGLPRITPNCFDPEKEASISDKQLAQYLQFYGIGSDLIEQGESPTIKSGQRTKAETLMKRFLS